MKNLILTIGTVDLISLSGCVSTNIANYDDVYYNPK